MEEKEELIQQEHACGEVGFQERIGTTVRKA
jgi:hypothetical protein